MRSSSLGVFVVGLLSMLSIAAIGCGDTEAKYIPSEETAREALNVSLTAWRDGQPHRTITSWSIPIDVYDARWQAGTKLETFEVVREEILEDRKAFIVKMKVAGGKEEPEVTYLVIGNNPLMVFRKQDYDKASGVGGG